ncbi:MAG TPA: hypothetical protein VEF33_05580 [Syntrophales bacterium]|nr:hypothetical protein [Syntrophales bacterium]
MERDRIIKKLKDIKDPKERDRIIWALAGKEKDELTGRPDAVKPKITAQAPPPERAKRLPQAPLNARKLLNYVVPGFFLFFGLVNLIQAIMQYHLTGQLDAAIPQLIMGTIFLLFGIIGIFKAKKRVQSSDEDQTET